MGFVVVLGNDGFVEKYAAAHVVGDVNTRAPSSRATWAPCGASAAYAVAGVNLRAGDEDLTAACGRQAATTAPVWSGGGRGPQGPNSEGEELEELAFGGVVAAWVAEVGVRVVRGCRPRVLPPLQSSWRPSR